MRRGRRAAAVGLAVAGLAAGAAWAAPLQRPAEVNRPAQRGTPPVRSFTLAATGDILTENLVLANGAAAAAPGERYDFGPLFARHAPIVSAATLAICHMEVPLGWPGAPVGAHGRSNTANRLLGPAEMAAAVAGAGYDRCSTASNHSYDLWASGIDSTLGMLDAAGVTHAGTARSAEEAAASAQPFLVHGVQVSHLSWSVASNTELPEQWRFHYTARNPAPVLAEVAAARAAGAEVVIVSVHTGRENVFAPVADDRAFVTALTASGQVDLVIGHGPHVIQPIERVNGTWVYWSLGNLVSGMPESNAGRYTADARDGLLAWAEVRVTADGTVSITPSAVLLCNQLGTRTVWPAVSALADPATPAALRPQLEACITRATRIVAPLL
ncbi:MAG TPA: CapA family protein [Ilumatobacter sp.]|nr:CapA family protein [Ilumatobacter sp.]